MRLDTWVWGNERILWGQNSSDKYTVKILEPKVGRFGCLSLQYHDNKDETWVVIQGEVWALIVREDGTVCTKIMKPGDVQNLPSGMIHRLMGVTEDCRVLEASSLDEHAADKSVEKDVVRLDCVYGRHTKNSIDSKITNLCKKYTEEAIIAVINECPIPQYYPERFADVNVYRPSY